MGHSLDAQNELGSNHQASTTWDQGKEHSLGKSLEGKEHNAICKQLASKRNKVGKS